LSILNRHRQMQAAKWKKKLQNNLIGQLRRDKWTVMCCADILIKLNFK
jgi:hypothetical protein